MKKKTNIMRVAVALLALTLITSCFVGGTFAKYTTSKSASQSARVAKFGVTVEGSSDLFAANYATNDTVTFDGEYSVQSSTYTTKNGEKVYDKVVAPGTSGEATLFTLTGKPEVAVRVNVTLNNNNKLKMIYLGLTGINYSPSFEGWSANGMTIDETTPSEGTSSDAEYFPQINDSAKLYVPIVWTLKKDNTAVCKGDLAYINQYLEKLSGDYAPNSDEFAEICGTYTLSWKWLFEHPAETKVINGETIVDKYKQTLANSCDTKLGNLMAGTVSEDKPYSLNEEFALSVSVEQID